MQAQNSCSSASIENLFGAKGFSGLCKSFFTGGRSASRRKLQLHMQESTQDCGDVKTHYLQPNLH